MKYLNIKTSVIEYLPIYIITSVIVFVMNYFCRSNDSEALSWILAPTARLVSILSGISFEHLPHKGYASHFHQFLIAPSCSGIRFMLITFIMLTFSFLYKIKSTWRGSMWFLFSAAFAYTFTIFINSIRIIVSIRLPLYLEDLNLIDGWLTPDRLHTMIGTGIYFSSLCTIYLIAAFICKHMFLHTYRNSALPHHAATFVHSFKSSTFIVPLFWYLLAVLALPLVKRIYRNEWNGFASYAALIICICSSVVMLLHLLRIFSRIFHCRKFRQ